MFDDDNFDWGDADPTVSGGGCGCFVILGIIGIIVYLIQNYIH